MEGTRFPRQGLFTIPLLGHTGVKAHVTQLVNGESTAGTSSPKFCSWGQSCLGAQSLAVAADRPQALALTLSGKLLNFPVPRIPNLQNEANRTATQSAAVRMKRAGAPRALAVIITLISI